MMDEKTAAAAKFAELIMNKKPTEEELVAKQKEAEEAEDAEMQLVLADLAKTVAAYGKELKAAGIGFFMRRSLLVTFQQLMLSEADRMNENEAN